MKKLRGTIPTRIFKISSYVISPLIRNCTNQCFKSCKFSNKLKLADTPIPKKGDSQSASDYRPISILPSLSKIFEKLNQLSEFFETKFSLKNKSPFIYVRPTVYPEIDSIVLFVTEKYLRPSSSRQEKVVHDNENEAVYQKKCQKL